MTIDLSILDTAPRLLFAVPLAPLQGQRFQPTGFPAQGISHVRVRFYDVVDGLVP